MCWSQELIHQCFCADSISSILLKYLKRGPMIVLACVQLSVMYRQNEILKTIFGVSGLIWQLSHKHNIFFFLLFLKRFCYFLVSYNIKRMCTFRFSISGARDRRLNYNTHWFTTEIRKSDECTLLSGNFY